MVYFKYQTGSTDDGIKADIKANINVQCEKTGNELLKIDETDGEYHAYVRKLVPDEQVIVSFLQANLNSYYNQSTILF